jgi:hypothetical protein
MDGDVALGMLTLHLADSEIAAPFNSPTTDADGRVVRRKFSPGRYYVSVDVLGYWRTGRWIDVDASEAEHVIEVRRTGDVEVHANAAGVGVEGARIELVSEELGTSADAWIAEGRITGALTTGADGTCTLRGLPRGRYAWRVIAADGRVAQGDVEVPPHGIGRVAAEL